MQVSGGVLEELERIRKVLEYFEHVKIHIGIGGEPGENAFQKGVYESQADLLTICSGRKGGRNKWSLIIDLQKRSLPLKMGMLSEKIMQIILH